MARYKVGDVEYISIEEAARILKLDRDYLYCMTSNGNNYLGMQKEYVNKAIIVYPKEKVMKAKRRRRIR